jgi:hypothetical protein
MTDPRTDKGCEGCPYWTNCMENGGTGCGDYQGPDRWAVTGTGLNCRIDRPTP